MMEYDPEVDAEWDETPVFAPDEPDVIRANMPPVSRDWLLRAFRAVFGTTVPSVRCSFDPDDYPII